jgi:hypothetical protein
VTLLPKCRQVTLPKQLRPISLVPVVRKLAGGIALKLAGDVLRDADPWQFAYKSGYQVADLIFVLNILGQKATEWRRPYILGVADIPKCFDELSHSLLLEALLAKGMFGLAAWFMREVRSTTYFLKCGGVKVPPIHRTRGIPQGTKWGPALCKAALSYLLAPVWRGCQADKLGYCLDIECIWIPFLFFCDNLFILAHSASDFKEITERVRTALSRGGWRLPDDRIEWQANNACTNSPMSILGLWKNRSADMSFKALGPMLNVRGSAPQILFSRSSL